MTVRTRNCKRHGARRRILSSGPPFAAAMMAERLKDGPGPCRHGISLCGPGELQSQLMECQEDGTSPGTLSVRPWLHLLKAMSQCCEAQLRTPSIWLKAVSQCCEAQLRKMEKMDPAHGPRSVITWLQGPWYSFIPADLAVLDDGCEVQGRYNRPLGLIVLVVGLTALDDGCIAE
ncbi:hypothetical protein NDU88_001215 [Pleurodeles waltl]|uniref:Uncharacterized protein n=1 Tax=Pleurodeles waltl TaxID=8319 RepID=A0AAV7TGZ3_PLEWA|nr:hypothetical protein NDU88_001215 [Pleurodeles waltl]